LLAGQTKKELTARQVIEETWPKFREFRAGTYQHVSHGRRLSEQDVASVFESLLTGPLGYSAAQIRRQSDFIDYELLARDLKLAVVETKGWEAFRTVGALDDALEQAAKYAARNQVKHFFAFDGEVIALAIQEGDIIKVFSELKVDCDSAPEDLFFFTEYGLSKVPDKPLRSFQFQPSSLPDEYKKHHGVALPRKCFAYVGDPRDKATWRLPYRNSDLSVDTSRIDKAVNYLLSPGGYRGVTVTDGSIPEGASIDVAKTLARAYKEIGRWNDAKCKPVERLRQYLQQKGVTEDQF
jgi:hypothetical protein